MVPAGLPYVSRMSCTSRFGLSPTFAVTLAAFRGYAAARTIAGPLYDTWLVQHIRQEVRATVPRSWATSMSLGKSWGAHCLVLWRPACHCGRRSSGGPPCSYPSSLSFGAQDGSTVLCRFRGQRHLERNSLGTCRVCRGKRSIAGKPGDQDHSAEDESR